MDESKKVIEPKDVEIISMNEENSDIQGIATILEGVVTPFAKAQEASEKEATKRTTILAKVAEKLIYAVVLIVVCVLILAAYSLSLEQNQLAEKIVIALLAFLGGLGAGRVLNK